MEDNMLHDTLQRASRQVKEAQEMVIRAQGADQHLLEQAERQLKEAELVLQQAQDQSGTETTENPQFQQAYEQLHHIRQQLQDVTHNFKEMS